MPASYEHGKKIYKVNNIEPSVEKFAGYKRSKILRPEDECNSLRDSEPVQKMVNEYKTMEEIAGMLLTYAILSANV